MMNNILLIHMGRHKTGTTALQTFLSENREKLEPYGWCYPDLKKELPELQVWPPWQTEKNGAHFFTTEVTKRGERILYERGRINTHTNEWNKIWEWLLKCLRNKNVIISEEALWYNAEEFLTEAKKKYENIKVVVYLRRQDRAMESWWNQMIKGGRWCDKTFNEYLNCSEGVYEIREGFHYLRKLDQISKMIGKENCIVRVYEKQQLRGEYGVISDFLSLLGFVSEWKKWKKHSKSNSRLTGNYIEIKRVFNSIRKAGYLPSAELVYIFETLSQEKGKEEKGYFITEERVRFMEQFLDENKQIAREYLQRKDGELFYDKRMEFPVDDIHRCNSFEEKLIQTFSAMLCVQQEEIEWLRKQNRAFAWKLIREKVGTRNLLLFGAGKKCIELLEYIDIPVTGIVDNDVTKKGMMKGKIQVLHTREINDWSRYFVVITCVKTGEIEEQLQRLGLRREEDYVAAKEYFGWV